MKQTIIYSKASNAGLYDIMRSIIVYRESGTQYVEKTYEELTELGFKRSGDDTTWAGASGHESENYARIILNVTDAHVQAGEIVFRNSLAGGIYDVGANILRDGEYAGFGYGETNATSSCADW